MSPAASTSAFLQSAIPAWVRSRSSFTSWAVISAMVDSPASVGGARAARAGPGVDRRRVVALRTAAGQRVLAPLHPLDTGVGHAAGDEPDRPDGVVVAGD